MNKNILCLDPNFQHIYLKYLINKKKHHEKENERKLIMTKKNRLLPYIEEKLEVSMFASRWFMEGRESF